MTDNSEIMHATTVSINGRGILIVGPSGSGKSSLALQLLALGGGLVADDRTQITLQKQMLIASVPSAISGLIEARGVGLIAAPYVGPTPLALVIDLSQLEKQRLPATHTHTILGISLRCFHNAPSPHFAAAIWLYVHSTLDRAQ
ncbi:MAG: HPr kinase/phosphorylase [Sulfitobacter sp.]